MSTPKELPDRAAAEPAIGHPQPCRPKAASRHDLVLAIYGAGGSALKFDLSGPGFAAVVGGQWPAGAVTTDNESAGAQSTSWASAAQRMLAPNQQRLGLALGRAMLEQLLGALPEAAHRPVLQYLSTPSSPWSRRLIVCAEPQTTVGALPFEALLVPAHLVRSAADSHDRTDAHPIALGHVQLLRYSERAAGVCRPAVTTRLRVLLIVGDISQRGDDRDGAIAQAVANVQRACAELVPHVELHVLVTAGALAGVVSDGAVYTVDDVLARVRQGYHVVHYLGHAQLLRAGVAELEVHFPGEAAAAVDSAPAPSPSSLTSQRLAAATAGTENRLIVLSACTTADTVADAMLVAADHVVAMAGKIDPVYFPDWCTAFYRTLAQGRGVGQAVQQARASQPLWLRWTTQHSARTLDMKPRASRTPSR